MYIVTNSSFAPMNPLATGFKTSTDKSAQLLTADESEARAHAEHCAKKFREHVFHVMKVTGSVSTVEPPVAWK